MTTHTTAAADSLERSLRSFSIHDSARCFGGGSVRPKAAQKSETTSKQDSITLDLNSETPLPYMWEQCLDLKTGEIYFINRSNGVKTKEDPRGMEEYRGDYYYSDDEEDEEEDDDDNDSEYCYSDGEGCGSNVENGVVVVEDDNVLVAAGCRSCLMYYMVPKQVNGCPKCNRQLLHFDRLVKPCSSPAAAV